MAMLPYSDRNRFTEVSVQIAIELPHLDRVARAHPAPKKMHTLIVLDIDEIIAVVGADVQCVTTLEDFTLMLGCGASAPHPAHSIPALPPHLQGEPLAALVARINTLAAYERQAALEAFLAAAQRYSGPKLALLDELMQAAAAGSAAFAARERSAALGPAKAEISGGANWREVAKCYGIAQPALRSVLEQIAAVGPAKTEVSNGALWTDVAERYGITHSVSRGFLEIIATLGPATAAISDGDLWEAVAVRHGIADPVLRRVLESTATHGPATVAISRGGRWEEVADLHGIVTPYLRRVLHDLTLRTANKRPDGIHLT